MRQTLLELLGSNVLPNLSAVTPWNDFETFPGIHGNKGPKVLSFFFGVLCDFCGEIMWNS